MSINELAEFTRISKYSRYLPEKQRRETWTEQVNRMMDMHKLHLGDKFETVKEEWELAKKLLKEKKILGSQRALQFGGKAILDKNERIYNCAFTHMNRVRVFQETMYTCLCGTGVGFSVQRHHVDQLPELDLNRKEEILEYEIKDSIEGWADAIGVLVNSYFDNGSDLQGHPIVFDYTKIRPQGALIKSSGAKAPGPDGLRRTIECVDKILLSAVENGQKKLRPLQVHDIVCHIADSVVSGGVRRAALISLFSKDDEEMIKCKTGDWFISEPQRGRANNSVLLVRDETTREEFAEIMKSVKMYGEPGFVFVDDTEIGVNPCAEIGLYPVEEETGKSGFSFCNLTEINAKKCKTEEDFYEACRGASILGTIQASYTNFPYLGETTQNIVEREALLGVSITSMQDNPLISLDPKIQEKGANVVKKINKKLTKKIEIQPSARTTTIKPSGTASIILGSGASGIHPNHSNRYIRRVQCNSQEGPLQFFKMYNPDAVEQSVWDQNGVTEVISFVCEVPKGARTKKDVNAIQLLENVKSTWQHWVNKGKDIDLCVNKVNSHNVSNTINVKDDEWVDVEDYIYNNRHYFAGISLLSSQGDKIYPQAPFQAVYTEKELVSMYGTGVMFASGLIVHALKAFDNNLFAACDCLMGIGEKLDDEININVINVEMAKDHLHTLIDKKSWVERAKKFANNYFDGDLQQMTFCLKDVDILKTYTDLSKKFEKVPWEKFIEVEDHTKISEDVACGGGSCEIKSL